MKLGRDKSIIEVGKLWYITKIAKLFGWFVVLINAAVRVNPVVVVE